MAPSPSYVSKFKGLIFQSEITAAVVSIVNFKGNQPR